MKLNYVAHSEIGLVRKNNQDSGYASPTMLMVADGMGGAAAGDLASAVAIDELRRADSPRAREEGHAKRLLAAVEAANAKIAALVEDDPRLEGMGTTVCGGMFDGERLSLIHIGDSRGYLLRDGELRRLTHDHTWVQSLVDDGKIAADEAMYHPHRSLLLKVVNGNPHNTYDQTVVDLQEGDRLLFCSDGLCGLVEDDLITEDLSAPDVDTVLDDLIESAHAAGGLDNITLVVADVVGDDAKSPRHPLLLGAAIDVQIPALCDREDTSTDFPAIVEDPEDARYRPVERTRRGRWWWWPAVAILVIAMGVGGALLAKRFLASQFYVGTEDETVLIYKGVPDSLGPLALSRTYETTTIRVSDLPRHYADQVRRHDYRGLTAVSVRRTVAELEALSKRCITQREARAGKPTPTPGATPPATPTTPALTAAPTPSTSTTPDPTEDC